ncbi:MAG TPA: PaaI family thioesterase [Xanthobacteraceae bacterium]|nr:PaaI family thioesterase [Xanthobacteraceae bacterium]
MNSPMSTQNYGTTPPAMLAAMSGLEFLQAMFAGELPHAPMMQKIGFTHGSAEKGLVTFRAVPTIEHYNPIGSVHGGFAATLLDSAMGCAVQSMLPAGTLYTTLEFKVSLLRAITTETGEVVAEGRALNVGRRVGTSEGKLFDGKGRLLAHGTTTCLVFEAPRD